MKERRRKGFRKVEGGQVSKGQERKEEVKRKKEVTKKDRREGQECMEEKRERE